jgi:predicted enzyme related to lactoylglutathione lyase
MGSRKNFGPIDIPVGRFAHVSDPDGANLHFIQLNESLSG